MKPFPVDWLSLGPLVLTDATLLALFVSLLLLVAGRIALHFDSTRRSLEVVFDFLENAILGMTTANVQPLVPLILTQWLFLGVCNLLGLVPGLMSPTRDLSLAVALASIAFFAGHIHAIRTRGFSYLRQYVSPSPFLLPFNIIGELSRTVALALRLFGNMLSGTLVGAIVLYLAGALVPVPLMLLSALTAVVQAYIFGVLTLVFAASSIESTVSKPTNSRKSP